MLLVVRFLILVLSSRIGIQPFRSHTTNVIAIILLFAHRRILRVYRKQEDRRRRNSKEQCETAGETNASESSSRFRRSRNVVRHPPIRYRRTEIYLLKRWIETSTTPISLRCTLSTIECGCTNVRNVLERAPEQSCSGNVNVRIRTSRSRREKRSWCVACAVRWIVQPYVYRSSYANNIMHYVLNSENSYIKYLSFASC